MHTVPPSSRSLPSESYVPQTMPKILGTFDMTATLVLAIYAIAIVPTAVSGGAGAYLYWLIGAVFFLIPCAVATAQLGVMLPYEGSLYNWAYHALGRFWSFFVGLCSWLPGPIVVVGIGVLFVQICQGLNSSWLTESWQQGLVILAVIVLSTVLSLQRFGMVQKLVNVAFACGLLGTLTLVLSALVWLLSGHHSATNLADWHAITPNTYSLYGIITFAYIGVNLVLNMGGEVKTPRKSIPRHVLLGSIIVFCCYLAAMTAILVVQGSRASFVTYSIISTVDLAFGKWGGNLAAVLFLTMTIPAAAIYNYAYARLLMVGGIDHLLPSRMAKLNRHRVPSAAVVFQAWFAAAFTLLVFVALPYLSGSVKDAANISAALYYISQAAATLIWAISILFLFIILFFLRRRKPGLFRQVRLFPPVVLWGCVVLGSIAIVVAIVNTLLYSWISPIANQQWFFIVGGLTLVCLLIAGLVSFLAAGQADWETMSEEVRSST